MGRPVQQQGTLALLHAHRHSFAGIAGDHSTNSKQAYVETDKVDGMTTSGSACAADQVQGPPRTADDHRDNSGVHKQNVLLTWRWCGAAR